MTNGMAVLADAATVWLGLLGQGGTTPAPGPGGQGAGGGSPMFLIGLMIFLGVFFFISTRSQKKERQKTADMIDNLKKNDKVLTVGGIVGTVMNVKENEVVLKVDESTNTRMTFLKRAIQQVLTDGE